MHDLGRSKMSRSQAMQNWGEDSFTTIIQDELSVVSEQTQGYHNTTNHLIFYDIQEDDDAPTPSVSIKDLDRDLQKSKAYTKESLILYRDSSEKCINRTADFFY